MHPLGMSFSGSQIRLRWPWIRTQLWRCMWICHRTLIFSNWNFSRHFCRSIRFALRWPVISRSAKCTGWWNSQTTLIWWAKLTIFWCSSILRRDRLLSCQEWTPCHGSSKLHSFSLILPLLSALLRSLTKASSFSYFASNCYYHSLAAHQYFPMVAYLFPMDLST